MKFILILIALCLATGAYAADTVLVDRDGVTTPVDAGSLSGVATAAQGAKADGALQSANYKVKNVLALGILNDGSDQGAAINALLAAATDGDVFYFPKGTYGTSVRIVLPVDTSVVITGDGPQQTWFKALASMTSLFYKASGSTVVQRPAFSGFGIKANKLAGIGMELQSYKNAEIKRVYIEDYTGDSALLLGKATAWNAPEAFYEGKLTDISIYLNTGNWPDQSIRPPYGVHFQGTATDNHADRIVVAYARTAGIYSEWGNAFSEIHPWGSSSYPTPYGIILANPGASVANSEFDNLSVAAVKVNAGGNVAINGNSFVNGTPTGVEIANAAPNVSIAGNVYDSNVTNKYLITGAGAKGTNFAFVDGVTFGTAAGNLVQLDGSAKVPSTLLPAIPESGVTNLVTDLAAKQDALVSGTNIKTVNGVSLLGIGDLVVQGGNSNGTITALTGDVTASGSGTVTATVIQGSTTTAGKLQLTDSIASTSTTTAATPNSVKQVNDAVAAITSAKGTASGYASLNSSSLVMQNPASINTFAGANQIPITDANGNVNLWMSNKSVSFTATNAGTNSTAYYPYMRVANYANGTAGAPYFSLRNSSGTSSTDAASTGGQLLGSFRWYGRGATADKQGADISATVTSTYTDADQPTDLTFSVGTTGRNGIPLERMRIMSTGNVGIGTSSPTTTLHVAGSGLFSLASDTAASRPTLGFLKSRVTGTAVQAEDKIGSFQFQGYDSAGTPTIQTGGLIEGYVDGTVSSGHVPTRISFTTGTNSSDRVERLVLKNDGGVIIGTNGTSPGANNLSVAGDTTSKTFTHTIPAATTPVVGGTTQVDLAAGTSPSVTLTGNTTLAFSNPKPGQYHQLNLVQDATGSRTVTWPSTGLVCTWRNTSGHTAPTLLTAAAAVDTFIIHTLSTTSAECWTTGNK